MIEITCNDRLGKKVRIKCNPGINEDIICLPLVQLIFHLNVYLYLKDDTIGDLKKLISAQTGTHWEKIVLKKWYTIYKDHITLQDYEIHDGMNLELYYQ